MKYNKLVAICALLSGANAARLEAGDMGLNQRKLYAYSLKQTGSNIQLYDTNKSEAVNNKEYEEMNMHLLQV